MTDKETLFLYRLKQADETLSDARKMLKDKISPRSIINRAYYSMFYGVLALFLKHNTKIMTSKHSGIIGIFDAEFVHMGKIDCRYSKLLHQIFEARQEADYKELVEFSHGDAEEFVKLAQEFLEGIKKI
jgi:uncharacterized protein (UPF0332 family)